MIVYLLKSIACLLLLLLVHRVLLQREVLHRFNRFFLLFSVIASFLIPFYTIEVPDEIAIAPVEVVDEPEYVEDVPSNVVSEPLYFESASQEFNQNQVLTTVPESQFSWGFLLFGLYGLISLVFFFRFVRNIKILVNKIQRNIKINYRGQTLVLLKEESLPFSFLKYIFVAESDLENGNFTDAVFAHECAHVQEKHSWDNLFIEALLVPFWFHPGLHWAKASIKLNHEFIADEIALRSTSIEKYESQLLAMMLSNQKYGLASSLNFSLTKKRFEMMKRKSKNLNTWIKVIALVPVLGTLVYIFSEKVTAKADETNQESEVFINNSNQKYLEEMDFDLSFTLKPDGVILFENENYDLDAVKELISESKKSLGSVKINLTTESELSMGDLSDFQAVLRDLDIRRVHYVDSGSKANEAQEKQKAKLYSQVRFLVEDVQMNYIFKNYSELTHKERSMLLSPPLPPPGIKEDGTVAPSFENERENDVSKIPHIFFTPDGDPSLTYNLFTKSYVEDVTSLKNGKGSITITPTAIYLVDISNYANPADYFFQKFSEYESLRSGKPHYVNKSRKDQAIMDALFYELTALSYQFSEEIRSELGSLFGNQYSPLNTPISPYVKLVKDGEIQYKKRDELNDVERQLLPPPHPPLPSVWETTKPSVWETTKPSKHVPADKQSSDAVEEQKAKLYSDVRFRVEKVQMYYISKNYSELTDRERSMLLSPSSEDDRGNKASLIPHIYFTPDVDSYLSYNSFNEAYEKEVTRLKNGKGFITISPTAVYLVDISKYANAVEYFSQKFAEYESLRSGEPHYLNRSRKDQAILEALYFELDAMYYQFSAKMRSQVLSLLSYPGVNPLYIPIYPYTKLVKDGEIHYYKDRSELNDVDPELIPPLLPPPPIDWKTKYPPKNSAPDKHSNDPVATQKVVTSSKWPPGVRAAKEQDNIQSYNDVMSVYEKLRHQAPHFIKRSKEDQHMLIEMFSDLRSMYQQMSFFDKAKFCQPSPPFAPYMKLESNGEVYYKLSSELTAVELSKFPSPPTPVEQVKAYKKVYYKYQLTRNKGRSDAYLSMQEREAMFLMYNELQEKFLYMDAPERRQVKMVNFPYYRVEEEGKMIFKAISELSPEQRALNNC